MKRITFLLMLMSHMGIAQSNAVADLIQEIKLEDDTLKSVYIWIADNIKYDVKKLNRIKKGDNPTKKSSFKNKEEYHDYLISKVIKNGRGVCQDYSLLFDAILRELGYESYIIEGYTKNNRGKINRKVGHTWNTVKVKEQWQLFDLTWGAGSVRDGKKFVKKLRMEWYNVDPKVMIKDHMPYDPMWQLLENPLSYENFDDNTEIEQSERNYNYETLILEHSKGNRKQQMEGQVRRSMKSGEGIRIIREWRKNMTQNIGVFDISSNQGLLEQANGDSQKAVSLYNEFIKAKNNQFKGKKYSVDNAKENLEMAKAAAESAFSIFTNFEVTDKKANKSLSKAAKHCGNLLKDIDRQSAFLEKFQKK